MRDEYGEKGGKIVFRKILHATEISVEIENLTFGEGGQLSEGCSQKNCLRT
jgi:hypothetical protein